MNIFEKIIEKIYLHIDNNLVYYDSVSTCKSRYYYDHVAKKKYHSKNCCVVFVDINNMKKMNDTKGHDYGTAMIKCIGEALQKVRGVFDVCRIGGDEFVIFANNNINLKSLKGISHIAYGCYYKSPDESVEHAVDKADALMYIRKNQMKN